VRRRVLNCVLSAKGVFEKVQWVWRERRSVEQSGSCSGVSFGICLIDPYQCINLQKWRFTFVNLPDLSSSTNFTKWKGKCEDQRCQLLSIVNCKSAGWFASLQVWEIFQSSKDARTFLIYGLVLNCLRERIYPLCLAKPPQAFPCSLIEPSVFILIHSFPGGQHTIEYVCFWSDWDKSPIWLGCSPILPLLSLIKLEILASNLHIFANPFPFGFLKTLTYL
jgi:hypothetical protein